MAELIGREDTLNEGREKINDSIKDSNVAKTDAAEALTQSTSTQEQLDNIIVESGTSDAEVVQARTDETGEGHTTLKSRIDDGFGEVKTQLADKVTKEDLGEAIGGIADATPLFAEDVEDMIDVDRLYVNTSDGYLYRYDVDTWINTDVKYQEMGLASGSVSPDKTTFINKKTNLFNGRFEKGRLNYLSESDEVNYSFEIVDGTVAIIPVEAGKMYNVKVFDPSKDQFLIMATVKDYPEFSESYKIADGLHFREIGATEHTFTVAEENKYLLVLVSLTSNDPRLLQVSEKSSATYTKPLSVDDKYLDMDKIKRYKNPLYAWKEEIDDKLLPNSKKSSNDRSITDIISMGGSNHVVTEGQVRISTDITKIRGRSKRLVGDSVTFYEHIDNDELKKFHTVGAWLYIPEEHFTSFGKFTVKLETNESDVTFKTSEDFIYDGNEIEVGWNLVRFSVGEKLVWGDTIGKIDRVVIHVDSSSNGSEVYLGGLWVEKFEKSKILFIHDGAYADFFDEENYGYRELKERGIPVTIATIVQQIFSPEEGSRFLKASRLYELSRENNNDVSIHSNNADDNLPTMSPEEIYEESWEAVSTLRKNGYNPLFRAAFFRNNAPNAYAAKDLYDAFAAHSGTGMQSHARMESFPFTGSHNVRRVVLHNKTNERLDEDFNNLRKINGVMVCYTHRIENDVAAQMDVSSWEHFLNRIDQGVSEGWLECVTYPMLKEGISDKDGYFS